MASCPFFNKDQGKMYRTGDFGILAKLNNGNLVLMYEGRIDSQIKVRGQRVDLSEIEAGISRSELVSKVKVLCYHPEEADQVKLTILLESYLFGLYTKYKLKYTSR